MPTGQMIKWNADKGFGFIKPDGGGEDLFCHASGLLDGDGSVQDGDNVVFKIEFDDRKGKDRAVKVQVNGSGGGRSRGRPNDSRSPPPRRGGGRGRSRSPPRGGGRSGGGGSPGTGTLLRWTAEKGFGFIKPDKGDEDLFCHVSELLDGEGSVQDGDRVSYVAIFDERKGKKRATQVVAGGGGGRGARGGGGRGGRNDDSR